MKTAADCAWISSVSQTHFSNYMKSFYSSNHVKEELQSASIIVDFQCLPLSTKTGIFRRSGGEETVSVIR
jgi:hypothetical protein